MKYTDYTETDPVDSDVIGLSRSPFTGNTFFSTTFEKIKEYVGVSVPTNEVVFGTGSGISSSPNLTFSGSSLILDGSLKILPLSTAGILHNDALGEVTSSLIVNNDIDASAGIVDTKLDTITTAGKVANSATTATASNAINTIVLRDGSGNFTAGIITATLSGNATTATTATNFSGSLSGMVTGPQTNTAIASGVITNTMINAAAGIVDTKLATISTAGKVSNSATTATSANTASAIVSRDGSGNFSAGTITATLSGNATTATTATNFSGSLSGDVSGTQLATVIGNDTITNAKMANMANNTFKGNVSGSTADPSDLTVAQMKTALGIVGSVTIADTQIAFGNSSNNIAGSANLTWDNTNKVMTIGTSGRLQFTNSANERKVVLYDVNGNDYQYYGFGIGGTGLLNYTVDAAAAAHVFWCGASSTTRTELARIRGNGTFSVGTTCSITNTGLITTSAGISLPTTGGTADTFAYYEEDTSITLTLSGPWGATTVTLPVTFSRAGNMVTMKWGASSSSPVTSSANTITSGQSAGSVYIPNRFIPDSPANAFWYCPVTIAGNGAVGSVNFSPNGFGTLLTFTKDVNNVFPSGSSAGILPGSISYLV